MKRLLRRIIYEGVYAWACIGGSVAFNRGFAPVDPGRTIDAAFSNDLSQIQLYAELVRLLPNSDREFQDLSLLDAPAGCGGGLRHLKNRYPALNATGVDTSLVARLRSKWLGVRVVKGEMARLPFADKQFDCVLCVEGLFYDPPAAFLREGHRVLKEGGYLLVAEAFRKDRDVHAYFSQLGTQAGFEIETIVDATAGVRQALHDRYAHFRESFLLRIPFVRERFKEMLCLPDSEQFLKWQTGKLVYQLVMLRRRTGDVRA